MTIESSFVLPRCANYEKWIERHSHAFTVQLRSLLAIRVRPHRASFVGEKGIGCESVITESFTPSTTASC